MAGPDLQKILNIKEKDAVGGAKIIWAVDTALGIQSFIKESTPKKAVIHVSKCPFFDLTKGTDLEIELKCSKLFCGAIANGLTKTLTDNLKISIPKTFQFKDDHCEKIIETI
jgi:hypothetical protein